ncbi:MAG: serine--tRNA ligase [Bacteroidales bacterium]|nr:serine--tRNA ligase [Bacteroidales bacterium]MCF8386997.1 serine--tRNA ligase [Bacteroidales bacterium]MCF8397830.1 serine--tRNA ligase [Bacteroidales bacterium]
MLQLSYIQENKEEVLRKLAIKNFHNSDLIHDIISLDQKRKETQKSLDDNLARANSLAKEVGKLFKEGRREEANAIKEETANLKHDNKELAGALEIISKELNELLLDVPNIPHESVKAGKGEEDNEILVEEGKIPATDEKALPHWELASKYKIIDFKLGSKVTGAGFPFYRGKGAKLQRALISFFLDEAIASGYEEFQPPLFVNEDSAYGTGQLPDKEGQMYHIGEDRLYPIPTAEVPITNIYRDVILKEDELPVKNVAYSSCFRREAGSYGKDVRGLNRLHQFDKVEIVQIQHPERSYETLEEMKDHAAGLLKKLGLPYRILRLCGGDLSFTSALTYDFEVYSAAQKRWLEVSSVSNFENYQANRMKLRFKGKGKTQLAHTLNGSALALPRIVAALLENNQTEKGIEIPEVLVPYTGFEVID